MQVKTINYKRILNVGNYESKHLEMFVEIHEGDDVDAQTTQLMELVERKIREDSAEKIELKIEELQSEVRELIQTKTRLKQEIESEEQAKMNALVPVEHYLNDDDDDDDEYEEEDDF